MPGAILGVVAVLKFCARKIIPRAALRDASTHRDLTSSLGLVGDQVNLAEGIPCVVVDGLANWAGWAGWAACPNFHHKIEKQIGDSPIR